MYAQIRANYKRKNMNHNFEVLRVYEDLWESLSTEHCIKPYYREDSPPSLADRDKPVLLKLLGDHDSCFHPSKFAYPDGSFGPIITIGMKRIYDQYQSPLAPSIVLSHEIGHYYSWKGDLTGFDFENPTLFNKNIVPETPREDRISIVNEEVMAWKIAEDIFHDATCDADINNLGHIMRMFSHIKSNSLNTYFNTLCYDALL
jgi:hypothetical protein